MPKRNIKLPATAKPAKAVAAKPGKPVVTTAAQATPSVNVAERRATSRKLANTAYADHAAYPYGKLSATDSAYLALFAVTAKRNGGAISTSALDLAETKPTGISITNNRARAHRLIQAGFLSRTSDDLFAFVKAVTHPTDNDRKNSLLLPAITAYAKA